MVYICIYDTLNIPPELIVPFDSCCCWSWYCCWCCCCYFVCLSRVSLWCFLLAIPIWKFYWNQIWCILFVCCSFISLYSLHTFIHLYSIDTTNEDIIEIMVAYTSNWHTDHYILHFHRINLILFTFTNEWRDNFYSDWRSPCSNTHRRHTFSLLQTQKTVLSGTIELFRIECNQHKHKHTYTHYRNPYYYCNLSTNFWMSLSQSFWFNPSLERLNGTTCSS